MANTVVTSFGGLIPRKDASNGIVTGGLRRYFVPASDATAIYPGDPVIIAGDGDAEGTPTCTRATAATGRITGVMVGVDFNTGSNAVAPPLLTYRPASQATYILVDDNPNSLFEIQEDAVGGALASTNIGQNASLVAGTGGAYGSGWLLQSSTAATTNTLQVRIIGLVPRADNAIGGYIKTAVNGVDTVTQPARWYVRINQPTETGAAGSTGV